MQNGEEEKVSNLWKSLHHYESQNSHLNNLNNQLVNANRMIKQDLNANYAELVKVIEEALKRQKTAQEENAKLLKQNQKLQDKVPTIEEELTRLQRRSQALASLNIFAEVARNI